MDERKDILVLRSEHTRRIYKIVKDQYRDESGVVFKFEKGERERCKQMFVRMKEVMELKRESDFEEILTMFERYVAKTVQDWIRWDSSSRQNYIGYLNSIDRISLFVKNRAAHSAGLSHSGKDYAIAGTGDKSDWK